MFGYISIISIAYIGRSVGEGFLREGGACDTIFYLKIVFNEIFESILLKIRQVHILKENICQYLFK